MSTYIIATVAVSGMDETIRVSLPGMPSRGDKIQVGAHYRTIIDIRWDECRSPMNLSRAIQYELVITVE